MVNVAEQREWLHNVVCDCLPNLNSNGIQIRCLVGFASTDSFAVVRAVEADVVHEHQQLWLHWNEIVLLERALFVIGQKATKSSLRVHFSMNTNRDMTTPMLRDCEHPLVLRVAQFVFSPGLVVVDEFQATRN